jgi:L-threonylcarbamoyladenylate synthase
MRTEVISTTGERSRAIRAAVSILEGRGLVALPTETVYGLAGDALDPEVLVKIFEAKERPFFDPLIVHVLNRDWLESLVDWDLDGQDTITDLINRFWPGPLTLLVPRTSRIPDLVTAGLNEVAVRAPSHPIFAEVLRELGKPLAAPSANRFGRVSPTTAVHVFSELEGRIPLILDAGATSVGLESTVVRVRKGRIEIIRPGPITDQELAQFAPVTDRFDSPQIVAPGQMESHYAPKKKVHLFQAFDPAMDYSKAGLLCWGPKKYTQDFALVRTLSESRNMSEAARQLFALLRELDEAPVQTIYAETVPAQGIGKAIMNRLRRAAGKRKGLPG